jgi:hypothetical protein
MLPDLRVLLLATITTFLLATGAGLYASVHLLPDPLAAAQRDRETPVSRVALSWQDMTRAPLREFTPVAIRTDEPDISPRSEDNVMTEPKAEDRPIVAPAAPDASPPAAAESVATKSDPAAPADPAKVEPATTGAIGEAPAAAPAPEAPPKFAARPEPVEATTHAEPAKIAAPVTPPKARAAKPEPRKTRRHRVVRQSSPQPSAPAAPSDGSSNYFIEFGSRANQ